MQKADGVAEHLNATLVIKNAAGKTMITKNTAGKVPADKPLPWNLSISGVPAGSYTIEVTLTDDMGTVRVRHTIALNVTY